MKLGEHGVLNYLHRQTGKENYESLNCCLLFKTYADEP